MLLHDIEDLDIAELSTLSEKISELTKRKEEKARLQLLQRNADKDEQWLQKIEQTVASFQQGNYDPTVSSLVRLIKGKFGIVLQPTHINTWLKSQHFLSETDGKQGKKRTVLNEKSGEVGMYTTQKVLQTGFVYDAILFSPKGVRFVLEHIKDIVLFVG